MVKYDIVPVPENDHFADAAKLPPLGGVVEAFNTFATMENSEPKHGDLTSLQGSLWWNWSPAESGTLHLDISGIRPKIYGTGEDVADFRFDWADENGWLDLWGIESPALTASLAIAEHVGSIVMKRK